MTFSNHGGLEIGAGCILENAHKIEGHTLHVRENYLA